MNWSALFQQIITSGVVIAGVVLVFWKYVEKSMEQIFDRKLKEFEARLSVASALWIEMGRDRTQGYRTLSSLVLSVGRHAIDVCQNPEASQDEIEELTSEIRELERTLYGLFDLLTTDRIFSRVHAYKANAAILVKNLENEGRLRRSGSSDRADIAREDLDRAIAEIQTERQVLSNLLAGLIPPKVGAELDAHHPKVR